MPSILACGINPVMTTETIGENIAVIDTGAQPGLRAVADITFLRGRCVSQRQTVTTAARTKGLTVIKGHHRSPRCRRRIMAGTAVVAGRQVPQRQAVTGNTATEDLGMIHTAGHNRCPAGRELIMTGFTGIAGCDMKQTFAAGRHTVMTTDAVTGNERMIRE